MTNQCTFSHVTQEKFVVTPPTLTIFVLAFHFFHPLTKIWVELGILTKIKNNNNNVIINELTTNLFNLLIYFFHYFSLFTLPMNL
jgi:hypothetical protein